MRCGLLTEEELISICGFAQMFGLLKVLFQGLRSCGGLRRSGVTMKAADVFCEAVDMVLDKAGFARSRHRKRFELHIVDFRADMKASGLKADHLARQTQHR